jgi:Tfp pilus assembly protein PilN
MKRRLIYTIVTMLFLFSAQICSAQTNVEIDGMKKDISALKEGQQAIQKELAEIKTILRQKPAQAEFKETVINVENDPSKGDKKAKLALIEFSDYQ